MKIKNKTAFSLIELSIVILIVGILVAGVVQTSRLVTRMRILNAQTVTRSSEIHLIKGLSVWIETVSEKSFDSILNNINYFAKISRNKIMIWQKSL